MTAVTIYSDSGAQKVKPDTVSTVYPSTVNYVNLKLLNIYIIGTYKKIWEEEEKISEEIMAEEIFKFDE